MYISLVPRPSASRARIAYVTFEPLSDRQGFKGHVCDARATGRRPGNEAMCILHCALLLMNGIDSHHEVYA